MRLESGFRDLDHAPGWRLSRAPPYLVRGRLTYRDWHIGPTNAWRALRLKTL